MTRYFLTGGTGFLGRRLISRLLAQPACEAVYVLVREGSLARFDALARHWDSSRIVPVTGDLTLPALGAGAIAGPIDHVVHLGAIYDFTAIDAGQSAANVSGTQNVIDFAGRGAGQVAASRLLGRGRR